MTYANWNTKAKGAGLRRRPLRTHERTQKTGRRSGDRRSRGMAETTKRARCVWCRRKMQNRREILPDIRHRDAKGASRKSSLQMTGRAGLHQKKGARTRTRPFGSPQDKPLRRQEQKLDDGQGSAKHARRAQHAVPQRSHRQDAEAMRNQGMITPGRPRKWVSLVTSWALQIRAVA